MSLILLQIKLLNLLPRKRKKERQPVSACCPLLKHTQGAKGKGEAEKHNIEKSRPVHGEQTTNQAKANTQLMIDYNETEKRTKHRKRNC